MVTVLLNIAQDIYFLLKVCPLKITKNIDIPYLLTIRILEKLNILCFQNSSGITQGLWHHS